MRTCHSQGSVVQKLTVVASLIIACGASGLAAAEDWPEFRGPTGQGHSAATDLPTQWSPTKNVRWKTDIEGKGWSSPIVFQGRVYLTTAVQRGDNSQDQSLRALCLDAASGEILWNSEVFDQHAGDSTSIHNKNTHASPTPIIDGEYYRNVKKMVFLSMLLSGMIAAHCKVGLEPEVRSA